MLSRKNFLRKSSALLLPFTNSGSMMDIEPLGFTYDTLME